MAPLRYTPRGASAGPVALVHTWLSHVCSTTPSAPRHSHFERVPGGWRPRLKQKSVSDSGNAKQEDERQNLELPVGALASDIGVDDLEQFSPVSSPLNLGDCSAAFLKEHFPVQANAQDPPEADGFSSSEGSLPVHIKSQPRIRACSLARSAVGLIDRRESENGKMWNRKTGAFEKRASVQKRADAFAKADVQAWIRRNSSIAYGQKPKRECQLAVSKGVWDGPRLSVLSRRATLESQKRNSQLLLPQQLMEQFGGNVSPSGSLLNSEATFGTESNASDNPKSRNYIGDSFFGSDCFSSPSRPSSGFANPQICVIDSPKDDRRDSAKSFGGAAPSADLDFIGFDFASESTDKLAKTRRHTYSSKLFQNADAQAEASHWKVSDLDLRDMSVFVADIDRDTRGYISKGAVRSVLRLLGRPVTQESGGLDSLVRRLASHNVERLSYNAHCPPGTLSFSELVGIIGAVFEAERDLLSKVFQDADPDSTGSVSSIKLQSLLKAAGLRAPRLADLEAIEFLSQPQSESAEAPCASWLDRLESLYDLMRTAIQGGSDMAADATGSLPVSMQWASRTSDCTAPRNFEEEEFHAVAMQIIEDEKEIARDRAGLDNAEVQGFRLAFDQRNENALQPPELGTNELLEVLMVLSIEMPDMSDAHEKNGRATLEEAMRTFPHLGKGHGLLSLPEFLQLVRRTIDDVEVSHLVTKRKVFNESGFADSEIDRFREVYRSLHDEDEDQLEFNFFALKKVVRSIGGNLDAHEAAQLKEKFRQHAVPSKTRERAFQLTFLGFISIMGGYRTLVESREREEATEQLHLSQLLQVVEQTQMNEIRSRMNSPAPPVAASPDVQDRSSLPVLPTRRMSMAPLARRGSNLMIKAIGQGKPRRPSIQCMAPQQGGLVMARRHSMAPSMSPDLSPRRHSAGADFSPRLSDRSRKSSVSSSVPRRASVSPSAESRRSQPLRRERYASADPPSMVVVVPLARSSAPPPLI